MDPLMRPYVEIECKECAVIDIIYMPNTPGTVEIDLHGWTACQNSCCWLCPSCKGKRKEIFIEKVIVRAI